MKTILVLLLSAVSTTAFGADMKLIESQEVSLGNQKYKLEFHGFGEFCSYEKLEIYRGKKKIGSFDKLCGREIKRTGEPLQQEGKFAAIVKVGAKDSDTYLYIREEPSNYVYKTSLIAFGKKATIAYAGNIDGEFKDYSGDRKLDVVKKGGGGEPHGKGQSYDPYLVFEQKAGKKKPDFVLNEDLSKKFSEENKFTWNGSKYDEKIVVDPAGNIVK